jgi:hypothetical protein
MMQPIDTLNIGRTGPNRPMHGKLGNPYRIGSVWYGKKLSTAGATLPLYERYLRRLLDRDPDFAKVFDEALPGRRLWCPGCGCDSPTCHGRIIEKLLKERADARQSSKP